MRVIYFLLYALLVTAMPSACIGRPPDAKIALEFDAFRQVVADLKATGSLSSSNQALVVRWAQTKDPILLSASAWLVGEATNLDSTLITTIQGLSNHNEMCEAFVQIAVSKREARAAGKKWDPAPRIPQATTDWLRFELARELLHIDPRRGKEELAKMEASDSPSVKWVAKSVADRSNLPLTGLIPEDYNVVLRLIGD